MGIVGIVEGVDLPTAEVGGETGQQVPKIQSGFAHHRGGHHQPQSVKARCGLISVCVRHQRRSQDAIIVQNCNQVPDGIRRFDWQKIVRVVVDHRCVPNGSSTLRLRKKCCIASLNS